MSDPPNGKPLCRDHLLEVMASHVSDVFRTGQARNLFIYGPPGTGKTACTKYLLKEIQGHAQETNASVVTAYVNAGRTRNPYYTLFEVVKQLGVAVPDTGWQFFKLKGAFENVLKEKALVIAIDEVESLLLKEKEPLVYYLNRQPKTTLILISNKLSSITQLPQRSLSTLQPISIFFKPFGDTEFFQIMKARADYAFKQGAISNELINTIAKETAASGDIRLALSTMMIAGQSAEQAGGAQINPKDIKWALQCAKAFQNLSEIEALRKRIQKRTGQIVDI